MWLKMSESSSDFTESSTETKPEGLGPQYTPTEEERNAFKQCDSESFWYRSVPFSASAMALAHMLVINGKLTASPRFGSLPKVLFAGMCGYFAGKLSYMKTCQQKFYNLENSPIGEALRQRRRHHQSPLQVSGPQSEFSKDEKPEFGVFQPESVAFQSESVAEVPYSSPSNSNATHSTRHHELTTHTLRNEEQDVKQKSILYEDLRIKNRENYDITRSQKIDREVPKKDVKKNKYGDTWEE